MSETLISSTDLGKPDSEVRHNRASNGQMANLYDYKENGWTIFTARCVQGKVTEVWDYRGTVDTSKPHSSTKSSTSSKSSSSSQYYTYDYDEVDDFYYDYYDDFYDYEDAEEYFYEHADD
jgi:hypothetical protein